MEIGSTPTTTTTPAKKSVRPLPTPDSSVDDIVTNPQTGEEVQVLHVIADEQGNNAYVLTSDGYLILTRTEVGDLIYCAPDPEEQDPPPCDVAVAAVARGGAPAARSGQGTRVTR